MSLFNLRQEQIKAEQIAVKVAHEEHGIDGNRFGGDSFLHLEHGQIELCIHAFCGGQAFRKQIFQTK